MKKSLLFAFVLVAALALLTCGLSGCSKHEHTYTINYNADGHWNDVTCGCTDVTPTVIPHSLEKERVVEATFDFGGYTEYVCSICGFSTQDNLSEKLPEQFVRCHRGFIVNKHKIKKVALSQNLIFLTDGYDVPLSRSYKSVVKGLYK